MENRSTEASSRHGARRVKRSGGDAVLVNKPAEAVSSPYAAHALEPALGQVRDRNLEVDPAVRALLVVVGHELPQHAVEVALASNLDPRPSGGWAPCRMLIHQDRCGWWLSW